MLTYLILAAVLLASIVAAVWVVARSSVAARRVRHGFRVEPDEPWPGARIRVQPASGEPGSTVTLLADSYKIHNVYPMRSAAFEPAQWRRINPLQVEATTVVRDVRPGTYDVSFQCGATPAHTQFTVVGTWTRMEPAAVAAGHDRHPSTVEVER